MEDAKHRRRNQAAAERREPGNRSEVRAPSHVKVNDRTDQQIKRARAARSGTVR